MTLWERWLSIPQKYRIIILLIFFIAGYLGEYIANPSIYKDRKEDTKLEYYSINPPEKAEKIKAKESIINKFTNISISDTYKVRMKKQEIEQYYHDELIKKRWAYKKTDKTGIIYYQKKDFLLAIVAKDNEVYVGIYYDGKGHRF